MLFTHIQYKIKNILKHEIINEHWINISSESINFGSHKHLENNLNNWNLQIFKSWKTVLIHVKFPCKSWNVLVLNYHKIY